MSILFELTAVPLKFLQQIGRRSLIFNNYITYFILYPRASAFIRVLSHFLTFSMTPQNVQGDIDCVLAYKVNRRPAFPDF